jgi:arsenical-resistance protein 2
VILHCSSSKGRGPRCAGWYQDYLDQQNCTTSAAYVLVGGINAWRDAYPGSIVVI